MHPVGVVFILAGLVFFLLFFLQVLVLELAVLAGIPSNDILSFSQGVFPATGLYQVVLTNKVLIFAGQIAFILAAIFVARGAGALEDEIPYSTKVPLRYLLITGAAMLIAIPGLQLFYIPKSIFEGEMLKPFAQFVIGNEDTIEKTLMEFMKTDLLLNILLVGVAPAICEEFLFRGVLQSQLQRFMPKQASVWVQAFIFSFIHFQFLGFFPRFIMGIGFGYLRLWTGSLWPAMVAHFANNTFSTIVAYLALQGIINKAWVKSDIELSPAIMIPSLILSGFLFYLLYQQKPKHEIA